MKKYIRLTGFLLLIITLISSITINVQLPQAYAVQPIQGTWTFTGLNGRFVRTISVDPVDSNILYAGTEGETGGAPGVFKSMDGGDN